MIDDPSRLRLIRKEATLGRILPYFDFSIEENRSGESGSTMTPNLIALTELLKENPPQDMIVGAMKD